jgi:WD40 repeat protein
VTSSEIADEGEALPFALNFYKGLVTRKTLRGVMEEAIGLTEALRGQSGTHFQLLSRDEEHEGLTLGDIVGDPLLGIPKPPKTDLPDEPFLGFQPFSKDHAWLFFGRSRQIGKLYDQLSSKDSPPLLLLHGQTGAGKSSLLHAGLVPRLSHVHDVIYRRRQDMALSDALEAAILEGQGGSLRARWIEREERTNRPLTVILDQCEEAYTNPQLGGDGELQALCKSLASIFDNRATRPRGKVVLAFRKDWFPEINRCVTEAKLPRAYLFIRRLDREGIIDAIEGPSRGSEFRRTYNLSIDPKLPGIIADDLLEDPESHVAPILQILLRRMWDHANKPVRNSNPVFTREMYQEQKAIGYWLRDFLNQQIDRVSEDRPDLVASGLLLDYLHAHTSQHGARTWLVSELAPVYEHRAEEIAWLRRALGPLYLLVEDGDENSTRHSTRLAHDTLAPLVREKFAGSQAPGQEATRVLESRAAAWKDGNTGNVLDDVGLTQVEKGAGGMRVWTADERRLVLASKAVQHKRRVRFGAGVSLMIGLLSFATYQWLQTDSVTKGAEATRLATEAQDRLQFGSQHLLSIVKAIESVRLFREIEGDSSVAVDVLRRALAATISGDSGIRVSVGAHAADIAPHGVRYAIASAESVFVGNVGEAKPLFSFALRGAHTAILSPEGDLVAAAADKVVELRSVDQSLRARHTFEGLVQPGGIAWSKAAGRLVVLVAGMHDLQLWDPSSDDIIPLRHTTTVEGFAVSPDGAQIATVSGKRLMLWDAKSRSGKLFAASTPLSHVTFNARGDRILVAAREEHKAWVFTAPSLLLVNELKSDSVIATIGINATGNRIVLAPPRGPAQLMDSNGVRIGLLYANAGIVGGASGISSVSFSRNDSLILTTEQNGIAALWTVDGGVIGRIAHDHVLASSFTSDSTAATIGLNGRLKTWPLQPAAYVWRRLAADVPRQLSFTPDGKWLVAASATGLLNVWEVETGRAGKSLPQSPAPISGIGFEPGTTRLMVAGPAGGIKVDVVSPGNAEAWNVQTHGFAVAANGRMAIGLVDRSIKIIGAGHPERILPAANDEQLGPLAIDRAGKTLVSTDLGGGVRVWRLADKPQLISESKGRADVSLAVDGPTRVFATFTDSGTVTIRSFSDGTPKAAVPVFPGAGPLTLSADGKYLAVAGDNGVALVYELPSGRYFGASVDAGEGIVRPAIAFSPNGKYLATYSANGAVTLWLWHPTDLMAAACSTLSRQLSTNEWSEVLENGVKKPPC